MVSSASICKPCRQARNIKKKKKDQHKNEETKEEHSKQQYTEQPEGGWMEPLAPIHSKFISINLWFIHSKRHPNKRMCKQSDTKYSRKILISILDLEKLVPLENQEPHYTNLKNAGDTGKQEPNLLPRIVFVPRRRRRWRRPVAIPAPSVWCRRSHRSRWRRARRWRDLRFRRR